MRKLIVLLKRNNFQLTKTSLTPKMNSKNQMLHLGGRRRENTSLDNHEITINFVHSRKQWNKVKNPIDERFAYSIATRIHHRYWGHQTKISGWIRSDWPHKFTFCLYRELVNTMLYSYYVIWTIIILFENFMSFN